MHPIECPNTIIELDTIWKSAQRFGKRIAKQEGYVPPEQYGDDFDEELALRQLDLMKTQFFLPQV